MRLWEESLRKHKIKLWSLQQCGQGGCLIRITFRETDLQSKVPKGSQGPSSGPHLLFFPRDIWKVHSEENGAGEKCGVKTFIRETVWAESFRPFIVAQSRSRVRLFVTPQTVAHQAPLSMGFSRQEHWSGCHALLQGIFPPRDRTCVSWTAGRFFTVWATRESMHAYILFFSHIFLLVGG